MANGVRSEQHGCRNPKLLFKVPVGLMPEKQGRTPSGKEATGGEEEQWGQTEAPHPSLVTVDHPDFQSKVAAAVVLSSHMPHTSREGASEIYVFQLPVDINCPNLAVFLVHTAYHHRPHFFA